MEGVGSRLGRASSRYGGSTAAAVFSGPVRKWKKEWVHVSSSSTAKSRHHHSQSNGSHLLLRRWTPAARDADAGSAATEERPRRKFRYTPVAVLEELKKAAAKEADDEMKSGVADQSKPMPTYGSSETNPAKLLNRQSEETDVDMENSSAGHLDLGLCLKGHNNDQDSFGKTESAG